MELEDVTTEVVGLCLKNALCDTEYTDLPADIVPPSTDAKLMVKCSDGAMKVTITMAFTLIMAYIAF